MIERKFVREGVVNMKIEEFLNKELERADYSFCEIKRTPLATRIIIHAARPGIVIGRGGENIARLQEIFKERFGIENPHIEVKNVENPYLDARVVAKRMKFALERGINYRRVVNMYLYRVMEAGAAGVEIIISGKLSGERHRTEKYMSGYVMKCGFPAQEYVDEAKIQAVLKPGVIGIKVKIMPFMPPEMEIEKKVAKGEIKIEDLEKKEEKVEEKEKAEEKKGKAKPEEKKVKEKRKAKATKKTEKMENKEKKRTGGKNKASKGKGEKPKEKTEKK